MGWLDDLRKWLSDGETAPPGEAASPPPVFTVAPRPFGVGRDVAGVEWQTDKRTSGLVRYRPPGTEPWSEVVDESRQRDHQRTLTSLTPATVYDVEVTAALPNQGGVAVKGSLSLRTLPSGVPPIEPPPIEPEPLPDGPPGTEEPIPHPPTTVNVLVDQGVVVGYADPGRSGFLELAPAQLSRRANAARPGRPGQVPGRMREAGFRGRDNALWYTLSRSYAEWNWR